MVRIFHILKPDKPASEEESYRLSKVVGPDGISIFSMLKKVGPVALDYLTHHFKIFIHKLVIPELWKEARIIPIVKLATKGYFYRPIFLLSSIAKVLNPYTPTGL